MPRSTRTPVLRSHISEYSASAALFQCQHSTHQDGQVFIPNIPDLYFNAADIKNLLMKARNGYTYFFTIPPKSAERNCSGTVVAIQYCYRVHSNRINSAQDVFSFHSVISDGFDFTVNSSFTVTATPHQENECTQVSGNHYLCCDTTTLIMSADNQLSISSESYTFGVTIIDNEVTPYAFKDKTAFVAEQFQVSLGTTIPAGTSYSLTDSTKKNDGLLFMRLIGNMNLHWQLQKCMQYIIASIIIMLCHSMSILLVSACMLIHAYS